MIKNKDIFLKELANEPDLQENLISLVFAMNPNIDISKREKFVDNIKPFYNRQKSAERTKFDLSEIESSSILKKFENKDFRIKKVKLSSVRGFPKSNKPFGIDFTNEKDSPESMVILGTNGSGKSSIYEAIEYSFCRRVGEAELRTFKECDDADIWFEKYLTNFSNSFSDCKCEIIINQEGFESFEIHNENIPKVVRQRVNPDTHFISDYDIYYMGKLDYENGDDKSFHYTIAKSLGLTELLEIEKNLKSFIFYRRQTESRRITALERENKSLTEANEKSQKEILEKEGFLKNLKEKQKNTPEDNRLKDTFETLNILRQSYLNYNLNLSHLIENAEEYQENFKEFTALKVKNGGYEELQFLNTGLKLLNETIDCPFCENSKNEKQVIETRVNERIENLESLHKSTQRLNSILNQLTEQLSSLINQLNLFKSEILKEIKNLQERPDFFELLELENKFLTYASNFYSSDFFSESFKIQESPNFFKNKFQFLYDFILRNLDYLKVEFLKFSDSIPSFLNKRKDIIQKIEHKATNISKGQTITEQTIGLSKDINELKTRIENSDKKIKNNKGEITQLQKEIAEFDEIKSETTKFQEFYHNKLNQEVDKAFAPIKLIVEEILEWYFTKIDEREIQIEISKKPDLIDEETGEVLSEIITAYVVPKGEHSTPLPVKKYLNTFHYRLFTSMVGISIAIASRINTGINLPLVLDDIFYASDFKNRNTIQKFIKSLFEVFETYTPALPLQLIMFTHDELIFEGALNAMDKNSNKNISFAKLFPHSDANEEEEYFNLIYKIPSYFPQKLFEKIM
jgi:hypothetical protein